MLVPPLLVPISPSSLTQGLGRVHEGVIGLSGAGCPRSQGFDERRELGLDCLRVSVVWGHPLGFDKPANPFDLVDAQRAAADAGRAPCLEDADRRPVAHVQRGLVHGLAVGDFRLVLQAGLVVLRRLLEGEVVPPRDSTQAEERDAELAVAELPPARAYA